MGFDIRQKRTSRCLFMPPTFRMLGKDGRSLMPFIHRPPIPMAIKYRVIRNNCRGFDNLPPRSPDAAPYDFFLWGYVKDQVYVPSLPASIPELKVRIRTATETNTAAMLQTVWNELDYRVDVCRITKRTRIEHL